MLTEAEIEQHALELSSQFTAVTLGRAAHIAAQRDRLHCSGVVYRFGAGATFANQCQLWAYHDGAHDDDPEPNRSSFPPT